MHRAPRRGGRPVRSISSTPATACRTSSSSIPVSARAGFLTALATSNCPRRPACGRVRCGDRMARCGSTLRPCERDSDRDSHRPRRDPPASRCIARTRAKVTLQRNTVTLPTFDRPRCADRYAWPGADEPRRRLDPAQLPPVGGHRSPRWPGRRGGATPASYTQLATTEATTSGASRRGRTPVRYWANGTATAPENRIYGESTGYREAVFAS